MSDTAVIRVVFSGGLDLEMGNWRRISGGAPDIVLASASDELTGTSPVVTVVDRQALNDSGRTPHDGAATIVVGGKASADDVWAALAGGASGFVQLESPVEELVTAIRATAAGHLFVPAVFLPEIAGKVKRLFRGPESWAHGLTQREFDVLRMLAEGSSNSEIATKLFISESTVRTHVLAILRKVGARNRTEAVVMATRKGILGDD